MSRFDGRPETAVSHRPERVVPSVDEIKSIGVGAQGFVTVAATEHFHQGFKAIWFLMNWTLPSAKAMLTPPGWLLLGGMASMGAPSLRRSVPRLVPVMPVGLMLGSFKATQFVPSWGS